MAYRDPYAEQYGRSQNQPQANYGDSVPDFNPYTTAEPHKTYEQPVYDNYGASYGANGYRDEPFAPPKLSRGNTIAMDPSAKEGSGFERGEFSPGITKGPKTARALRNYRKDFQGHIWTRGGRGRCIGRFCCCTFLVAVFLIVSVVLALLLWIRPPNIIIGSVETVATNGSTIQLQSDGVTINLGVNISVNNPNYFDVKFKKISAKIIYPINSTNIGSGIEKNLDFKAGEQKNFTFPFTIDYTTSLDPSFKILADLATKCGVIGSSTEDITVQYKITLALRVLFITISPVISNSMSFACPLTADELDSLLEAAGLSI